MPKPHSIDDITTAAFDLFGVTYGALRSSRRIYARVDGKFVPIGYELTYSRSDFDEFTRRFSQVKSIQYASDQDLGFSR